MNSGRKTPLPRNRPGSTPEASRRNHTPSNLNTTVSSVSSRAGSISKKFQLPANRSNLNQTTRRQLDVTTRPGLANSTINPTFKSSFPSSNTSDQELEYQLLYNEYLQALMKNQICKNVVEQHRHVLDDQTLIHGEKLLALKDTYYEFSDKIKFLKEQRENIETINFMEKNIDEICKLCSDYDMYNKMNTMHEILKRACDFVKIKNIKQIKTQAEYDAFVNAVTLCADASEKIINSGRNFQKIYEIAENARAILKTKENLEKTKDNIIDMQKTSFYALMEALSNIFANQRIQVLLN